MRWTDLPKLAVVSLLVAACGPESSPVDAVTKVDDVSTSSITEQEPAGTAGETRPGSDRSTTTAAAPSGVAEATAVSVTANGVEYQLSTADDITVGGTGSFYPTRCEANSFGAGIFWVVATGADETGARAEPAVDLVLSLSHDGASNAAMPPEFELSVGASPESSNELSFVLATDEELAAIGAPPREGDLGSWSVDGSRIGGEVTVFESDHLREFFTATFDITCPAG